MQVTKKNITVISKKLGRAGLHFGSNLFLGGICFVILYPLLIMVSYTFMGRADILDPTVVWIPKNFSLDYVNFAKDLLDLPESLYSTMVIGVGTALLQVIFCSLIGYGFARFKFKGKFLIFGLVIFTIVVPPQSIILPLYMNYRFFDVFGLIGLFSGITGVESLNLIDTYWTFYLPAIFGVGLKSGLYIYIFKQFYMSMPKELEEAGTIDGCSALGTYHRIMLPNAIPSFVVVILLSVVTNWNDTFLSVMFFNNNMPLAVKLTQISGTLGDMMRSGTILPEEIRVVLLAGCFIFIIPLLAFYVIMQRYLIESVERAGIVG